MARFPERRHGGSGESAGSLQRPGETCDSPRLCGRPRWQTACNTSTWSGCNDDSKKMGYRVQLDVFACSHDLLLSLVRRHELDIVDLAIAQITAQFLELLEVIEIIDLDMVGGFVVMASALVEIKSRMVLPRADEEPEVPVG